MSEPSASPGTGGSAPQAPIEQYVEANLDRYTPDTLISAAVAAGYPESDARLAIDAALARRRATGRRPSPRWVVVSAYILVYVVLVAGLLSPTSSVGSYGGLAVIILSVVMGLALLISIFLLGADWVGGAASVIASLVLLLVVGGSCIATTGVPFGLAPR